MRRLLVLLLLVLVGHQVSAATVVRKQAGACNGTCSGTQTASFLALPTVGDSVEVVVSANLFNQGDVSVADNQGNTYVKVVQFQTNSGNQPSLVAIWQSAAITTSSGTFTVTATFPATPGKAQVAIVESTGTTVVDATGIGFDGGHAGQSSVSVMNLHADAGNTDLVLTGVYGCGTPQTPGLPSGYTSTGSSACVGAAYAIAAGGAGSVDSATWGFGTGTPSSTEVIASFGTTAAIAPNLVDVDPAAWNATAGTTSTVTLYNVNAGDAIIASVGAEGTAAPSISDGTSYNKDLWTQQGTTSGAGIFSLFNASAGTHAAVLTLGVSQAPDYVLTEVSGVPTTNSLVLTAGASNNTTGPITVTTGAVPNAHDIVFLAAEANSFQSLSNPFGWTAQQSGSGSSGLTQQSPSPCISVLVPGSTAALSPSCGTQSSANSWALTIIGYAPSSGGGSSCTHSGWNLSGGTFSVPTAGTGTFWQQGGTGGSVNCTSNNYWSSTGSGTFVPN